MEFEKKALEIERCFSRQFPEKAKKYTKLLRREIKFPENIKVWEELVQDIDFIFKLAKEEHYPKK